MYTTEQIRDKSPISYSQVPPPAIYNDPPQLYPYRQPPPTQIHNHYQPPYSPYGQPPQPQIHNQPLYSPYGQPPPPQIHNQPPYSHGQATFQHHPVTIGVVHVVNMRDPNNPANSKYPVRMKCPACGENITTVTKHVTDCDSYIKAIVLLLVGMLGGIIVIERSGIDGAKFPLTVRNCLLGRDKDCDIINHTNVSNKHCGIWILDNGEAKITNFSTDYPLKVNNQVITKPGKLNHGDVFTIVDRSFRFEHCKTATCYPDQKSKCKKHCPEITERTKISKEKVKAKSRKRRREKRQRYKETCAQNKLQQELANSITETEIVTEETPVPCKIRKQSNNFYEDLKKDPLFSNMVQYRRGHRLAANLLKKNSVLNLSLHSHN